MVTGVETAGLVLAAFPLVVQALSSYSEGCGKIQEMFQYHKQLRKFSVELRTEYTKFHNTCQNLLDDLVSHEEAEELLHPKTHERGTELWSSEDLRKQLQTKLREPTVEAFLNSVIGLAEVLKELQLTFPIQDGNKGTRRQAKRFIRTIRFSMLSGIRQEKMAEVRQRNIDLESLSLRGRRSSDNHVGSKFHAAATVKFYLRVQQRAKNLFAVLGEGLSAPACSCILPHDAGLQLEVRSHKKSVMRFRTFISFEAPQIDLNWREIDVEPVEEIEDADKDPIAKPPVQTFSTDDGQWPMGASQSSTLVASPSFDPSTIKKSSTSFLGTFKKKTKRVGFASHSSVKTSVQTPSDDDLHAPQKLATSISLDTSGRPEQPKTFPIDEFCKTITSTVLTGNSCYGHLVDKENRLHRVWPPKGPVCNSGQFSTITLLELFQRQHRFSRKDRLILGIKLASSVLQLHSSGWLSEDWGSQDIVFFEDASQRVLFDNPIVRRATSTAKEKSKWLLPCNKALFSLGIVLIELYYGCCLDQCPKPRLDQRSPIEISETLRWQLLADELVNVLYDDAGTSYGDAVRRCIRGIDYPDRNLEITGFKEEVYRVVLCPLETSMEMFRTGPQP